MPEQFSFLDEPKTSTDRLFFAVLPDAATKQRAAKLTQELHREHGLSGKPVAADKLHVTLHFMGDHPGLPTAMIKSISSEAALIKVPVFTAKLDYSGSFAGRPDRNPLVLRGGDGVAGFVGLYKALTKAALIGKAKVVSAHTFTPHMTLFYGSRLADVQVEPLEWTVNEFVLLRSDLGLGKPYEVLGRWALQGY